MGDRELAIEINTNVKYQKVIIKNICNLHTVKETPKIIKAKRIMGFPTSEMIQKSISRMQETMEELNKSIMSSISDLVSGVNIISSIGESIHNSLEKIVDSIASYTIPEINISQEARNRGRFLNIAEENALPIFLETDTPLQENILKIVKNSSKDKLKNNLEEAMLNYYDNEQIDNILDYWIEQKWIEEERKKILKEAVEVYKLGYYAASTSTLMCQIGGVITRLYELANIDPKVEEYETEMLTEIYNISKINSEKMKAVVMMDLQKSGLFNWYRCANYLVYFVYSSNKKMTHFAKDPGRNKICHGEQYNYGNRLLALKAILSMDMIIQLSDELIE